jgi:hypothetical protein
MTSNGLSNSWVRPLILGVSCAIIGFVGGWVLNNRGGVSVTIPPTAREFDNTATAPSGKTTTVLEGEGGSAGAPVPPPDRIGVVVSVLNGTTTSGLAAGTAVKLRNVGYSSVSTGNTKPIPGQPTVYFREGQRRAAEQASEDLTIGQQPSPLPAGIARDAPAAAQVVVVIRAP